jgi:LysM repeat protein
LERIARRHGCTVAALARANGIKVTKIIHPGQKLRLPASQTTKAATSAISQTKAAASPPPAAKPTAEKHTVKPGDTFSRIARLHRIPLQDLMAANPDVRPERLRPGQVIRLTAAATASAPAAATPSPSASKPARNTDAAPEAPAIPATPTTPAVPATAETGMTSAPAAPSTPPATTAPADPVPVPSTPPATAPSTAAAAAPPATTPSPGSGKSPANTEKRIRSVTIENEMTYGEFAAQHGTDTERLNELNGLDLNTTTVLAKGSELYVPAEP